MPHVFISYVREDEEIVGRIAQELESAGIDVWLDRKKIKPGTEWDTAIEDAIRNGACFIACFTQAYADRDSTHMNDELFFAFERLRIQPDDSAWFLPVVFNNGKVPDQRFAKERSVRSIQWVDLDRNWSDGINTLTGVILRRTLADGGTGSSLPERALRWKRIDRLSDQLIDPTASVEERQYAARTLESLASHAGHVARKLRPVLADKDQSVRGSAILTLITIGEGATEILIDAIWSPFPEIRNASLAGLQSLGPRVAPHLDRLIEALDHAPASAGNVTVSDVLAAIGGVAVNRLVAEMSARNPKTLPGVARALGKMGSQASSCAPTMVGWLRDPDQALRNAATDVLGSLTFLCPERDWEDAVVPLAETMRDPDIGGWAHKALQAFGPSASSAIPVLIAILREDNNHGKVTSSHQIAQAALFNIGPDAVAALTDLLNDRQSIEDLDSEIRRVTARYRGLGALIWIHARYPDEKSLELIRSIALDPDEHMWLSAHAAAYLSCNTPAPEYLAVLKDAARPSRVSWDLVSTQAINALARFEHDATSICELMIRILESNRSEYVKDAAAETLGKLGSPSARAVAALRALGRRGESIAEEMLDRSRVDAGRDQGSNQTPRRP